jgi:hypothetical protein
MRFLWPRIYETSAGGSRTKTAHENVAAHSPRVWAGSRFVQIGYVPKDGRITVHREQTANQQFTHSRLGYHWSEITGAGSVAEHTETQDGTATFVKQRPSAVGRQGV